MTLPGTSVTVGDGAGSRSSATNSGTAFMVGLSDRGPVDQPVLVRSLRDARARLGDRVNYGLLDDALDVFFREGGSDAYVGRIVGPAAAASAIDLVTGATPTLTVNAASPGAWGDNLKVDVVAGGVGGAYKLEVRESTVLVESSPDLASNTEALAWTAGSQYVRLVDLAEGNPDVQSVSLTGGADDRSNIVPAQVQAALDVFGADLGPGQVAYPGATDGVSHLALAAHAADRNRVAILDGSNTDTVGTLTGQAAAVTAVGNGRVVGLFAPWAIVPGSTPGTERTVPYSAVQCGLIARSDGATGNPNVAVAGANGVARYATGLSQSPWDDSDREALNEAGVNVAIVKYGTVRTYGNRTCANPVTEANWVQLANSRLAMLISSRAEQIAEHYLFAQLDGRGIKVAEFAGDLQGLLLPLWQDNALYGATVDEAFSVNTGEPVNTAQSLAQGILNASISVRMSPAAERVEIFIHKVAAQEAL